MDFWDTFWATMWGALGGALVGALAAWGFALDLGRRDKKRAYKQGLDDAVGQVIQNFGGLNGAVRAFPFAYGPKANLAVETPHVANARLLTSIRVAQMAANVADSAPLEAAYELATAKDEPSDNQRELDRDNAADTLALWRRDKLTTEEAATRIRHRPEVPAPAE
ncbi:hypothetical protein ACTU6U_11155 [Microbacterium sp. A196]|uniref:hypothetical protein n=1 Tax=Microbacterium sp. A196 TaxID=3457320 RepID=UPI003FD32429